MPLSWNEIKSRAVSFSKEWEQTSREEADAKEFLIEFLNVFGITKRRVSTFEHKVKKLNDSDGYIDLLWPGMLLVEMKSRGKDLEKAYKQAKEYCHGLKEYELPKFIMISDFNQVDIYNETGQKVSFLLPALIDHIQLFAPLAGYQKRTYKEQDPVNIEAAERMGKLHDKLKAIGYSGHNLELYLVRLLFCLFADDTAIFERGIFLEWIEEKTKEDGSDLAANISQLFQVLNTPDDKRLTVLDEALAIFPYINGKLFEENLPIAAFDSKMRQLLLDCCALDWSKISPAIFGSLFQSVMDEKARRNLGAHYTSEKNILKLIKPLFLDDLWKEFETGKTDKKKLQKLHDKISKLRFLDPACGCGNFLVIAYRELRLLELEIVQALLKGQQVTSINDYFLVDVDQFYGIEYEEFPCQIAQVAMWLMDHQLNAAASLQFGEYYKRIPLKKSATIVHGNALRIDWQSIIDPMPWEKEPAEFHYILGNPPFYGSRNQNSEQKEDTEIVFREVSNYGTLDYVACWYYKASKYIRNKKTVVGFVSTSSISQGIQVSTLWRILLEQEKIFIHFAHQTFKWSNEAKDNAAVFCVIIGFAKFNIQSKLLFEYDNIKGEPHLKKVSNISPFLTEGKNIFIGPRSKPIFNVPSMMKGNAAIDDGNFIFFTEDEMQKFIQAYPSYSYLVKKFMGSDELINGYHRYTLWLKNVNPNDIRDNSEIIKRVENVRKFRNESKKEATRKWAAFPTLFMEDRQPDSDYLMIPVVSSELRKYIPIGFLGRNVIANYSSFILPNATVYHFGIITSLMHNIWIQNSCGKLEGRIRYSNTIGYNNFPWPENPSDKQKEAVERAAQTVLEARAQFPDSSLADLYDPNTMPPVLVKVHQVLDKVVDQCYRPQPFTSEAQRIEYLFELYDKYTAGLFVKQKSNRSKLGKKNPYAHPDGEPIDGKEEKFFAWGIAQSQEYYETLSPEEKVKYDKAQQNLAKKMNS